MKHHEPHRVCRWGVGDDEEIRRLARAYDRAPVFDHRGHLMVLFQSECSLRRAAEDAAEVELHAVSPWAAIFRAGRRGNAFSRETTGGLGVPSPRARPPVKVPDPLEGAILATRSRSHSRYREGGSRSPARLRDWRAAAQTHRGSSRPE